MTESKEQLLQFFNGLDVSTLEKLKKYAQLLIIPEEDLLINATMSKMVSKAHSLADSLFPEWTDRSKSDFGEFLVELFALFSEKDFWYINAFANEGILQKMRSYSNLFSKASALGYYPITCKSSSANFSVTFEAGEEVTYDSGDLTVNVDGLSFINYEPFVVEKSTSETTKQLTLKEGSLEYEYVTYNGYNIFIRKPNIDVDSIQVSIDNVTYTRVRNFGLSAPDSNHFIVLPEEDGSCSIHFGNNGFGNQPTIGKSILVTYRLCNGSNGNIKVSKAEVNNSLTERKATSVTMLDASFGGSFAESATAIKEKAPLQFGTKRAAINEDISEKLLEALPFIHKAKVTVIGKEVVYRVIPTSGNLEPTSSELLEIQNEFHPYIMVGYSGNYSPNDYRSLLSAANPLASNIILDLIVLSGYDLKNVEDSVRQIISDVTNPLVLAEYGGSFNKTDIDILIRSKVRGVQSVSFRLKMSTGEPIMPDVTLSPTEIFRKIDQDSLIIRTNVV